MSYSSQLVDSDTNDRSDIFLKQTLTPATDIEILNMKDGQVFFADELITIEAVAYDEEDGDITHLIRYFSSLDGEINNPAYLSVGEHQLIASVTDSSGNESYDSVNVIVQEPEAPVLNYCEAQGQNTNYEWIESVTLGQTPYHSGNNQGFFDHESTIDFHKSGEAITFTPGFAYSNYQENWTLWIDANRDGEFSSNEVYFESASRYETTTTVVLDSSDSVGKTKMRIAMRYGRPASPCGNFYYGEVEDFTINIIE
ncbi:GEVED domain-containing protein [Pleionea sediminis]|uniref:GEVED domain-containing protein n=1 Tax=Pleionea sediminis TaxID=2569479 RepID=UPI001184968A|nr:GEVED domain-containing protein [Pleionea sediminis]